MQIIPHITDEIKDNILKLGKTGEYDFVITEIGGTVGDIESLPYIESVRQLKWELGNKCINIHLTYVPYIAAAKEVKTKPTQHSVKELQQAGVQPDVLVLRTERDLSTDVRRKVALFCNVAPDAVIQSVDVPVIYEVPLNMELGRLGPFLYSWFIHTPYFSLVNIISGKRVVKELLGSQVTNQALTQELDRLLNNTLYRDKMLHEYHRLHKLLGTTGASQKAASSMVQLLQKP